MSINFECDICSDYLFSGEAFYGQREGVPVVSCFDCYIAELKNFSIGAETVFYNSPAREIEANDWLVFYDRDGHTLSKIPMHKIAAAQLPAAKEAVSTETDIPTEHITMVIEAHNNDVKEPPILQKS